MLGILRTIIFLLLKNLQQTDAIEQIFNLNTTYSLGEIPEKITTCKVKLANGHFIDLTSLDNKDNPRSAGLLDYNFLFNPCKIFLNLKFI